MICMCVTMVIIEKEDMILLRGYEVEEIGKGGEARGSSGYDINTTYSCKNFSKNNKFSCGLAIMPSALVAQVT